MGERLVTRTFMALATWPVMAAVGKAGGQPHESPHRITAPYGTWESPITTQMLVDQTVRFGDMAVDGNDLYWVESRPQEEGRYVIVKRTADGQLNDVLGAPYSARTTVHEYGGGALHAADGVVYFSNFADQRIYRIRNGQSPEPITPDAQWRFADFSFDATRRRLIAVRENHQTVDEPVNELVSVALDGSGDVTVLASGADFFSNPRLNPDASRLAWMSWNHPNMPWDGAELWVADVRDDGSLADPHLIAGGKLESIFQPEWSPDDSLYFVSDRSNWWNLYRYDGDQTVAVAPTDAEFGRPQWVFGMSTYGFSADGQIIATYTRGGKWALARINANSGERIDLDVPFTAVHGICVAGERTYVVAASPTQPNALVEVDHSSCQVRFIRRSTPLEPDPRFTSQPEPIEFPTDGDRRAHAFYYPPTSGQYQGPAGEAPPLMVIVHGGPTSATMAEFRLGTQFWTSRGFAVCDVNYGGSTGYGRKYREQLKDNWGIVDVADAGAAARHLVQLGKADPEKLIIRGGSAGGYTTLASLTFDDAFQVGASHYGISDLTLMTQETHKFESRYLDQIVGPYPQEKERYDQRSPIKHLNRFRRPVILLQGLEDKVVPPNQAEIILEALKKNGVPVAYVPFEGEQHGFRKADNIIRAHEAELYFYSRILGFHLPQPIPPVEIFNLD